MKGARDEPLFPVGALADVLLAVSMVSAGYGIVLPILPLMLQAIDGPSATTEVSRHTGLLTGVHALALFLFAPMRGKLSDHVGRRNLLCLGLIGFGASLLLSSVKLSIGMPYAERFFPIPHPSAQVQLGQPPIRTLNTEKGPGHRHR